MLTTETLGFLSPDQMALFIPIIALIIPIVAILTKHQRDMAVMYHNMHQQGANSNANEVEALRRQVDELRQLMTQQTLALDDIRMTQRQLVAGSQVDIRERLEQQ